MQLPPMTMGNLAGLHQAQDIAFESFGVRLRVTADAPEVLERIPALLPPDAQPCAPAAAQGSLEIPARPDGSYDFMIDGSPVTKGIDLSFALTLLEAQLRIYVGLNAPNRIFVQALVRAGAIYYSDEFAVLDERGLVHPFAKPVSVRDGDQIQSDHDIELFGGIAGKEPLEVGAAVFTKYRPGAEWSPTELPPGRGALAMFSNSLAAMKRSEEVMRTIKHAVEGALLLEGERGEADLVAQALLARVAA